MSVLKHLPNLITLLNLLSGIIAVFYAVLGRLELAALWVVLGIVFDFFDGFAARLLKVQGELGKQLDSLADMITSGLVPGIVMFQLLLNTHSDLSLVAVFQKETFVVLPFVGLLITLASAYRLAKFNIDNRQSTSFIGLPTPANTLLIISLPLIINYGSSPFFIGLLQQKTVLIGITLFCSYLLNAEIPLFALKFNSFSWKENNYKFLFLLGSVVLLILFQVVAIPLVILLYVLISVFKNVVK